MANKNRGWVTTRELWRSPKSTNMETKISPYKMLIRDSGYASWRLFSWMKIRKEDKKYALQAIEIETKEIGEAQSSVIIACQNAILQKDERITELEAKLESLRGYCRKLIEHFNSKDSRSDYDWGLRDRTITILDKLDEGKEQ